MELWQIMNEFDIAGLSWILHEMSAAELAFVISKLVGQGSQPPVGTTREKAEKSMQYGEILFQTTGLTDALKAVKTAKAAWERALLDNSSAAEIMHRLQSDIVDAVRDRHFLKVADDRSDFINQVRPFGDAVHHAFPSSAKDLTEAGNCLAAECNTAAVFHLMRASEIALRALARDRLVYFKDKPLDQKEWGQILGSLEAITKDMGEGDGRRWTKPEYREAQIRFYNEVIQEFRRFNEAWRKHLSHAHQDSLYDRDYASGVFKHVKMFMQKLATKISEQKCTQQFWDSP
jgi:hypothetical protein